MTKDNVIKTIIITGIIIWAIVSVPYIIKMMKTPINGVDSKIDTTKTYEQGLWDGFNGTIKYLDMKGILKDTIHINVNEISKIDSILHTIRK